MSPAVMQVKLSRAILAALGDAAIEDVPDDVLIAAYQIIRAWEMDLNVELTSRAYAGSELR